MERMPHDILLFISIRLGNSFLKTSSKRIWFSSKADVFDMAHCDLPPKAVLREGRSARMKKSSFVRLLVEVIKDAQIRTSFGNSKLDILFQIGLVTKEAAASTLEFCNHEDGIANTAQGEKVFLIGDHRTNRAQGTPDTQDQDAEEGLFVPQLISFIPLQAIFFSRGEGAGIEAMLPGIQIAGLTTTFFLRGLGSRMASTAALTPLTLTPGPSPKNGRGESVPHGDGIPQGDDVLRKPFAGNEISNGTSGSEGNPQYWNRTFLPLQTRLLFRLFHKSQHGIHLLLTLIRIAKHSYASMDDILEAGNRNCNCAQSRNMIMERNVRLRLGENGIGGLGDGETKDFHFILQRASDIAIEGTEFFGRVMAGVNAVLESIGVDGLSAAFARGIWGS